MVVALPVLAEILFWVGALIFCYLCVYIAKALFGLAGGTLGKLPVVGGWIDSGLSHVEQKIVSVMSAAALKSDHEIGAALHTLARLTDWIGREIRAHANLIALLAGLWLQKAETWAVSKAIAELRRLIHAAEHAAASLIHAELRPIHGQLRGIERGLYPRVRAVEHELDRVIEPDIAALRKRTHALEDGALDLFKWIRTHPLSIATAAFAGAVAVALQRLGASWIRCNNVGRVGRALCGVPAGLLEALLGDALLAFAVTDICEFAYGAGLIAKQIRPGLLELVQVQDALIGCHGASGPQDLAVSGTPPPPVPNPLPLAA